MNTSQNEIILYQPDEAIEVEVRLENETVWLNRHQMSVLFDRDIKTIGKHVNNALKEELAESENTENPTVANFATVQIEGNREVLRNIEYYSLDVILSVGYRVKSNRGIKFRAWANRILKDYLLKGYAVNQRIDRLERKIVEHDQKFDLLIKTSLPPKEGVFYDGQIFDAYVFVSDLIKSAEKTIILLDNYIDESVLLLLSKRLPKINAKIYTKQISKQLRLDLTKYNAQYERVSVYESNNFHDRFLLVDDIVYHVGASLKDLGKKLFAFSKMEIKATDILKNIETKQ